ncbi:Muramoyltetrapeptide carboxypeptidase [Nitrospina gracilis 3/211]|uniref:Muramoyltetrapeptide carboxypeptidase n=1 Tax=Nitrospina gracilis (strain 3/211) TaxID=1266370 RepID=M1YZ57_NITG3|nr:MULTISPECIES: LD-carboxypeptidase [Nitrospina]MCF8723675.1 muramoyltetrapeptide carboxypeptidase [Nitrospina sp. Nb-3]CCQ90763.1 Muramoyltetrapeptide carboxypeptidase [Nitrospina gracilis 3/211]
MAQSRLTRPKKLKQGDAVGIVAPAGPVDPEQLEKGLRVIRGMGFHPVPGENLAARNGFLAGNDADRAQDLMAMFENPEIKGIFCARGGYGVNRILPLLKPKVIQANPKVVVGSSDITLLLLYLMQKCSLIPFHGPMIAGSFGCRPMTLSKTQFRKTLTATAGAGKLSAPHARVLRPGKARGKLTGGCLTLLCRSLRTPYEIQTGGHLLVIEDVNEPAYRIDGMLWQLKTAGKFKNIKGLVVGEMVQCNNGARGGAGLDDVILDALRDASFPILTNCPVGHGNEMWTLPWGVEAAMTTESRLLEIKGTALT